MACRDGDGGVPRGGRVVRFVSRPFFLRPPMGQPELAEA